MKIIILGSNGMLGSYLSSANLFQDHELILMNRKEFNNFDFIRPDNLIELIDSKKPDVIINCVAITSIDECENDQALATVINAETPIMIAAYCNDNNIQLLHISTDHFFDDNGDFAHSEKDKVKLLNHYAESKFQAERGILSASSKSLVLRTSIVGRTSQQRSFLDWAIESIKSEKKLFLFDDAFTSFIHCKQLAEIIQMLISARTTGLYNVSCSDVFSKADFVIKLANSMNKNLNYEIKVISDTGHKEGMRMRDYGDFSNPESKKNALLVECGQHWEKSSKDVAIETLIKFLRHTGVMDNNFGEDMKDQFYYVLRKCLLSRQDWVKYQKDYLRYQSLKEEANKRRLRGNKLISFTYNLVNLPINILNFLCKVNQYSQYHKVLSEIEVMQEEINKYEKPRITNNRRKNAKS